MGSYESDKGFRKLPNLSALSQPNFAKPNLRDACYSKFHDAHKLRHWDGTSVLNNASFSSQESLSKRLSSRELLCRASVSSRQRLPKVELAFGLTDIDSESFPPVKSSRGFRGVLSRDSSHVKATSTRKHIAMRVYGDQMPLIQKDVQDGATLGVNSFMGEKGRMHCSLPSLPAARTLTAHKTPSCGLGKFPFENQSFVDLCKSTAFTPRLPFNSQTSFKSSTCFTPKITSSQAFNWRCSRSDVRENTSTAFFATSSLNSLVSVATIGKKTQKDATKQTILPEIEQKIQLKKTAESHEQNAKSPGHENEKRQPTTEETAENDCDSLTSSTTYVTADEDDSCLTSDLITADDAQASERNDFGKTGLDEMLAATDTNNNSKIQKRKRSPTNANASDSTLPYLNTQPYQDTPNHDEPSMSINKTNLPPLTAVHYLESMNHDADDEDDSKTTDLFKYRCRASRGERRLQESDATAENILGKEDEQQQAKNDETNDHDKQYKKFARSRRKHGKKSQSRKQSSPQVATSSSSTTLLGSSKKVKTKRKPRKKRQWLSEENLSRNSKERNANYDPYPQDGDNELETNEL